MSTLPRREPRKKANRVQEDARLVFACIQQLSRNGRLRPEEKRRYAAYCHQLGLLIRRSGLSRTLLSLDARKNTRAKKAAQAANQAVDSTAEFWLLFHLGWCLWSTLETSGYVADDATDDGVGRERVIAGLCSAAGRAEVGDYCLLKRRALELCEWFKSYAESQLGIERTGIREAQ